MSNDDATRVQVVVRGLRGAHDTCHRLERSKWTAIVKSKSTLQPATI
jgi:hypothetical protein